MGNHWASPGSFTTIASAILAEARTPLATRQYSAGGLTAVRAWKTFGADAVSWRPDVALLVVAVRTDADVEALRTLVSALAAAGTTVLMFDDVGDPTDGDAVQRARRLDAARAAGVRILPVADRLAASPQRASFLSLDGIHMTEPYHRLMAVAWLEALADVVVPAAAPAGPRR